MHYTKLSMSTIEFDVTQKCRSRPQMARAALPWPVWLRPNALLQTEFLPPERPSPPQFRSPPAFRPCRHALLDMGANLRLCRDEKEGVIHGQQIETE